MPSPSTEQARDQMSGGRASRRRVTAPSGRLFVCYRMPAFAAERVPLSGAARGRFGGDVSCAGCSASTRAVEVKCRGNGFRDAL